jgi:hypothetical protein
MLALPSNEKEVASCLNIEAYIHKKIKLMGESAWLR